MGFFALALSPFFSHAETFRPYGLTLDLEGQGAFGASSRLGFAPGAGAAFFADWRPVQLLSLGTGFTVNDYFASESFSTASWNLGGRLFPFPSDKRGEWYLQGTLGMNLETVTFDHEWPGGLHAMAGVGYRMAMNSGNALDLGIQYDFYSPIKTPMSAIGFKAGWTWLFGPDLIPESEDRTASMTPPASLTATPAPAVTIPVTVTPTGTPTAGATAFRAPTASSISTGSVTASQNPMANSTLSGTPLVAVAPVKHRVHHARKAPTPVPTPIETPTPVPDNFTTYTLSFGDKLDSIAIAFYGEGDLYPILVDANKATLGSPEGLKAGVVLRVPQGLTEADRAAARGKADSADYMLWEKSTAKSNSVLP
jgi:hypothetical protein